MQVHSGRVFQRTARAKLASTAGPLVGLGHALGVPREPEPGRRLETPGTRHDFGLRTCMSIEPDDKDSVRSFAQPSAVSSAAEPAAQTKVMRILVVTPHLIDAVVGAGGTMLRRFQEGHHVELIVAALGDSSMPRRELDDRHAELTRVSVALGVARLDVLFEGYEGRLSTLNHIDLIAPLDRRLDEGYDEMIFSGSVDDADHLIVRDACFAALREGARRNNPEFISMFEDPHQASTYGPDTLYGQLFVDTSEFELRKQEVLALFDKVHVTPQHWASMDYAGKISVQRGLDCGRDRAELLRVVKILVS